MTTQNGLINVVVSGAICIGIVVIFVAQLIILATNSSFFAVISIPIGIVFAIAIFTIIRSQIATV